MKRAVLYARVSGDDRGKDGRNLESQLEMGRQYAHKHGYEIVAELPEDDRGVSGADWNAPQINRALEMARSQEFDVLIVRELDRFARSLAKQLVVETEFRNAGVEVVYVLGEYAETPEGHLMKNVRAVIAEYERVKIAERTTRARFNLVRRGNVLCHGQAPYGYKLVEKDNLKALEIYEPEAEVVRMIFNWYVYGSEHTPRMSMLAIARKLTELGIFTAKDKGKGYKIAGKGEWAPSSVSNILHNETYAGTWYYGKEHFVGGKLVKNMPEHIVPVDVPAIISREVWEGAQKRGEENKRLSKRRRKFDYLLSGRVRCGECGRAMSGRTVGRQDKTYAYYYCHQKTEYTPRECGNHAYFFAKKVDTVVWQWVVDLLTNPSRLSEGLERRKAEQEKLNAPLYSRLSVIDTLLADNRGQLKKLLDLYLSDEFPKEMLTERKQRIEGTIAALEQERITLMATLDTQTMDQEHIAAFSEFAVKIREELEIAEHNLAMQSQILDMLGVEVRLSIEDDVKIVHLSCKLVAENERLCIASTTW